MQAHTIGGKIYLVGGLNGRQAGMHHVDVYDPLLDTFTRGAQATAGQFRLRYASAAIGTRIYVAGGLPQNDPFGSDVSKVVRTLCHMWPSLSPYHRHPFGHGANGRGWGAALPAPASLRASTRLPQCMHARAACSRCCAYRTRC